MALSKSARGTAITILEQINPSIIYFVKMNVMADTVKDTAYVFLIDEKQDGGVEIVYTYIENAPDKEQLFVTLAAMITNSHFIDDVGDGLLRIGFY